MPKPKPTPGERIARKMAFFIENTFAKEDAKIEVERLAMNIDLCIARVSELAAWDVMLNRPEENVWQWMEKKYGPAPKGKKQ